MCVAANPRFARSANRVKTLERSTALVLHSLQKFISSSLSTSFTTWKNLVIEERQNLIVIGRFIKRWTSQTIMKCYLTWIDYVIERRELRSLVKRLVGGKEYNSIICAFELLKAHAKDERERERTLEIDNMRRQVDEINQLGRESINNAEEQMKKARQQGEKAAKNMFLLKLKGYVSACFIGWKDFTRTNSRQRKRVKLIFSKMQNQKLSMAFSTWYKKVASHTRNVLGEYEDKAEKMGKELRKLSDRVHKQKQLRARKVFNIMATKDLFFAFEFWRDSVAEHIRHEQLVIKYASRLLNGAQLKVILRWRDWASENKRYRVIVSRFRVRLANQLAFKAYSTWYLFTKNAKVTKTKLDRFRGRMSSLSRVKSLNAWIYFTRQRRRLRELTRRILGRFSSEGLFKGFSKWSEVVANLKKEAYVINLFAKRWRNNQSYKIFKAWATFVESVRYDGGVEVQANPNGLDMNSLDKMEEGANKDLRQAAKAVARLQEDVNALEDELEAERDGSAMLKLESKLDAKKDNLEGMQQGISALEEELASKKDGRAVRKLEGKLDAKKDALKSLGQEVAALEEELAGEKDGSAKQSELSAKKDSLYDLQQDVAALEDELEGEKDGSARRLLESKLNAQRSSLEQQQQEVASLEEDLADKKDGSALRRLESKLRAKKEDLVDAKDAHVEIKAKISSLPPPASEALSDAQFIVGGRGGAGKRTVHKIRAQSSFGAFDADGGDSVKSSLDLEVAVDSDWSTPVVAEWEMDKEDVTKMDQEVFEVKKVMNRSRYLSNFMHVEKGEEVNRVLVVRHLVSALTDASGGREKLIRSIFSQRGFDGLEKAFKGFVVGCCIRRVEKTKVFAALFRVLQKLLMIRMQKAFHQWCVTLLSDKVHSMQAAHSAAMKMRLNVQAAQMSKAREESQRIGRSVLGKLTQSRRQNLLEVAFNGLKRARELRIRGCDLVKRWIKKTHSGEMMWAFQNWKSKFEAAKGYSQRAAFLNAADAENRAKLGFTLTRFWDKKDVGTFGAPGNERNDKRRSFTRWKRKMQREQEKEREWEEVDVVGGVCGSLLGELGPSAGGEEWGEDDHIYRRVKRAIDEVGNMGGEKGMAEYFLGEEKKADEEEDGVWGCLVLRGLDGGHKGQLSVLVEGQLRQLPAGAGVVGDMIEESRFGCVSCVMKDARYECEVDGVIMEACGRKIMPVERIAVERYQSLAMKGSRAMSRVAASMGSGGGMRRGRDGSVVVGIMGQIPGLHGLSATGTGIETRIPDVGIMVLPVRVGGSGGVVGAVVVCGRGDVLDEGVARRLGMVCNVVAGVYTCGSNM